MIDKLTNGSEIIQRSKTPQGQVKRENEAGRDTSTPTQMIDVAQQSQSRYCMQAKKQRKTREKVERLTTIYAVEMSTGTTKQNSGKDGILMLRA